METSPPAAVSSRGLRYGAGVCCILVSILNLVAVLRMFTSDPERSTFEWVLQSLVGNAMLAFAVYALGTQLQRVHASRAWKPIFGALAVMYVLQPLGELVDRLTGSGGWGAMATTVVALPVTLVLFIVICVRFWRLPLPGATLLRWYIGLQLGGTLLMVPFGPLAYAFIGAGHVALAVWFLRDPKDLPAPALATEPRELRTSLSELSPSRKGALIYGAICLAVTLLASAVSATTFASDDALRSTLALPAFLLAGPQWIVIEVQMMSENVFSVFIVSALYFPILFLPTGLYLIRGGRRGVAIAVQVVLCIGHVALGFLILVGAAMAG